MGTMQVHASDPGSAETKAAARLKARIIIPVWGSKYIERMASACLPALLAPGNLPHLAEHFDCELVVVTQSALFDAVRALPAVRRAQRWCGLRLVSMDDVLPHPSYYGLTITHSLYRGFTDLGEAAKDVWCLFLNADFILADGSYRALVARIQSGARCILSPSYCTVEENVWPLLNERVAASGVLAMPPREMAGLILDNRHFTIRAKTINWQMYRIEHVDQFYYVHDRDTLLGRQIPIAVVAFRPERVPLEPVAFWDYGVLSEICPSADLCVLGDSDDFLMMELRTQGGMADWLKLGWLDPEEIASQLSQWSTHDQRRCGAYNLVLHRADLPADVGEGIAALDRYYREVEKRLVPEPRSYLNHYIWTQQADYHRAWLAARAGGAAARAAPAAGKPSFGGLIGTLLKDLVGRSGASAVYRSLFDVLRTGYRALYGRLPETRALHPYRSDLSRVVTHLKGSARTAQRALVICSMPGNLVARHLNEWFAEVVSAAPDDILQHKDDALEARAPFDVCFLELNHDEFLRFAEMHRRLRALVRFKGEVIVFYRTRGFDKVSQRDFTLIQRALPGSDLPALEFRGGWLPFLVRAAWDHLHTGLQVGSVRSMLGFAAAALALGPLALLANWLSLRRTPGRFVYPCTSLVLRVTVI
jgi:hypothetical protein